MCVCDERRHIESLVRFLLFMAEPSAKGPNPEGENEETFTEEIKVLSRCCIGYFLSFIALIRKRTTELPVQTRFLCLHNGFFCGTES